MNKNLRLNNLITRTAINAKIFVFVICIEAIIYLLLHSLHDCTFKFLWPTNSKSSCPKKNIESLLCRIKMPKVNDLFQSYEWITNIHVTEHGQKVI